MNLLGWTIGLLGGIADKLKSKATVNKKNMFFIDVSKHNGTINWQKVLTNNPKVDLVIMKASEGQDFIDIKFIQNSKGAKAAGLKVGYYHFASLNSSGILHDATEEAKDFIATMKLAPKADIPPVLDLEENKIKLSPDKVLAWVNQFRKTMTDNGYPEIILYSYTPFLDANLPRNHNLGNMKLWIAGYVEPKRLRIPYGWCEYWAWQYSAEGRVNGISATKPVDVDLNTTKPLVDIIATGQIL